MRKINVNQNIEDILNDINKLKEKDENLTLVDNEIKTNTDNITQIKEDISNLKTAIDYKSHRFAKPINKIYSLPKGTKEIDIDFVFCPDAMEVRLNGIPLIYKGHSTLKYDYEFKDNAIVLRDSLVRDSTLWIKNTSVLDISMAIDKSYEYEDYINSFGRKMKRLVKEIWSGDMVKEVKYIYSKEKPHQIIEEITTRPEGTYNRKYKYNNDSIDYISTEGVDDFMVYRVYGGDALRRQEFEIVNVKEIEIKHNLNVRYPLVQLWENDQLSTCIVKSIDENTIKVTCICDAINGTLVIRR